MMQAMDMRMLKYLPLALVLSGPVAAQQVQPCESNGTFPYETTALAIAEPWEDNTRIFAEGQVRITIMDTYEPALGALYLMVIFEPMGQAADFRTCVLVSNGFAGFPNMTLEGLNVREIEGQGMRFHVPTTFYNPTDDEVEYGYLEVMVDRLALSVTAARL